MGQIDAERRVAGRYRLLESLGRGGMGIVWRAEDELLQRQVAVKEIQPPPGLPEGEVKVVRARVLREARAAARLTHRNVVTVYDVLEEDGGPWLVMELVDAPTLGDLVAQRGPLPVDHVARIGRQVLDALEAAHERGIVHRDVKPANVMVGDDIVKLADFGVATVKGDPRITATGLILGSPAYMPPEQGVGGETGPEADLWSLGATLYFALEGRPPFDKGQPIATLASVVHDEPPEPQRSGALGGLLYALLRKDPAERPSIGEIREALEAAEQHARGDRAHATRAMVVEPDATRGEAAEVAVGASEPYRESPMKRYAPWLVALGVLLIAALAGVALLSSDDAPRRSATQREGDAQGGARTDADDEGRTGANDGSGAQATSDDSDASAPTELVPYELPGGFSVSYPAGWAPVEGGGGENSVRFDDPAGSRYLLVAWTDSPGPDAYDKVVDEIEPGFEGRHPSYERVALEPTEFAGTDNAVHWEYTYQEGGARLHALNLQFVTDEYGFAINLQTSEQQWDESQPLLDAILDSFETP